MKIKICMWKMCRERYSEYILKRIENDIKFHSLEWIVIEQTPCMWHCKEGPNVMFDKHLEHHVDPLKASKMILDKKNWNNKPKKNNKK